MIHVQGLALVAALLSLSGCSAALDADRDDRRAGGGRLVPVYGNLEHIARKAAVGLGLDASRQYEVEGVRLCAVDQSGTVIQGAEVPVIDGTFLASMQLAANQVTCLSTIDLRSMLDGYTIRATLSVPTYEGWVGGYQRSWQTNDPRLQTLTYASQSRTAAGVTLDTRISFLHSSPVVATNEPTSGSPVSGEFGVHQTVPLESLGATTDGEGNLKVSFKVHRTSSESSPENATFSYMDGSHSYVLATTFDPAAMSDGGLVIGLPNGCRVGLAEGTASLGMISPACAVSGFGSVTVSPLTLIPEFEQATFDLVLTGLANLDQATAVSFQDSATIGTGRISATEFQIRVAGQ